MFEFYIFFLYPIENENETTIFAPYENRATTLNDVSLPNYQCYENGSVYGYEHDKTTGNCTCKPGWIGNYCQGKIHT